MKSIQKKSEKQELQEEAEGYIKYLTKEHVEFFLKKAKANSKRSHAKCVTVAKWYHEVELYTKILELIEVKN